MTLTEIIKEYEYLALYDCTTQSFEDYLRTNYLPTYDDDCNFKGYDSVHNTHSGVF